MFLTLKMEIISLMKKDFLIFLQVQRIYFTCDTEFFNIFMSIRYFALVKISKLLSHELN